MNIYQKINQVRQELLQQRIKADKKGFNYNYIDLPQIEGPITEACGKVGLLNIFRFPEGRAELEIVDIDATERLFAITIPVSVEASMVKISDKQPIQNVGGMMTYMRRYLYMTAYAISEHDAVEEQVSKDNAVQETTQHLEEQTAEKFSKEELQERLDMIDFLTQIDPKAVEKLIAVKKVSCVDELETSYIRKVYNAKKGANA